jgi:hypothetical protein
VSAAYTNYNATTRPGKNIDPNWRCGSCRRHLHSRALGRDRRVRNRADHEIIADTKTAGIGYHVEYIEATNPAILTRFFKFLVPILIVYEVTVNLAKLSIILFYRRLFPQRIVRWMLVATSFVIIGTAVGCLVASLVACRPFSANWGSAADQANYCFDREAFFIWLSFPNLVTDVVMLVLPMPIMWKLNAPIGIRLGLMATFALSALYVHPTWCPNPPFHRDTNYSHQGSRRLHYTLRHLRQLQLSQRHTICRRRPAQLDPRRAGHLPHVRLPHHLPPAP